MENRSFAISRNDNRGLDLPTADEVKALIGKCSRRAPTGVRNRALIAIMWRSGLRPGEALRLVPGDLNLDEGKVRAPARKDGQPRTVGVDTTTCELIKNWLEARSARGISDDAPVFCTLQGGGLKDAYVRELLPRLAHKANIWSKRIHPLALRYAGLAELVEEGMPSVLMHLHAGDAPGTSRRYFRGEATVEQAIKFVSKREWKL